VYSVSVLGSIGLVIRTRPDGVTVAVKPLLDQLMGAGFHVDSQGHVDREELQHVGED
jgi:predicted nucleic acid-binding protein